MEQKKNPESPDAAWGRPYPEDPLENWDGQDSSRREEPWEPDAIDLLLHPELAEDGAGTSDHPEDEYPDDAYPEDGPLPAAGEEDDPATGTAASDPGPPPAPAPARTTASGLYYPSGAEIPPTHPDHGPMHLLPRQEDGGFATYYYCSKAELVDFGIDSPPPRRHRRDGFHAERQEQFLRALRDTASWTDAARIVGISRSTAYNLYNNPDAAAFRAAVDEALKGTEIVLDTTALDRSVNGTQEIVYHKGRRVGVRWKYDNKLLMFMLRARNPLKYAPLSEIEGWLKRRGIEPPPDLPVALDRLHLAEAEWGRRLPGEGEAQQVLPGTGRGTAYGAVEGTQSPALPQPEPAPENPSVASTSSTSSDNGQPEKPALASTSSTSSDGGHGEDLTAAPAPPPAPDPESGLRIYRPPLVGRFRPAPDAEG